MSIEDLIFLGTVEINEGKRLVEAMSERGIKLELVYNKSECGGSCQIKVQLWGREQDLPELEKYISEEKAMLLEGMNVDPESFNFVFDPNQEEANCPACGTKFSTKLSECPDCGLSFGTPEDA